jgi:ABC-2 type transport system ATP-binding protein
VTDVAIRTVELAKRYGGVLAVDHINLSIPKGSIFGLIGPNGAGKTTTLAIMASVVAPTSGEVEVLGFDPSVAPGRLRRVVGYMPDALGVYDGLRVDEYLEFFAAAYRIPRSQWPGLIDGLLELVDLQDKRQAMVDSLSRGMKQRLSLARALVHDPAVLLLDEPASGLDPRARFDLRALLVELRTMGKTVVISSHILSELEEMCTDVAIMGDGKVLASGPPDTLRAAMQAGRSITVRLEGGEVQTHTVADDAAQTDLLRSLVIDERLPVLEFTRSHDSLEDLFLRITEPDRAPLPGPMPPEPVPAEGPPDDGRQVL